MAESLTTGWNKDHKARWIRLETDQGELEFIEEADSDTTAVWVSPIEGYGRLIVNELSATAVKFLGKSLLDWFGDSDEHIAQIVTNVQIIRDELESWNEAARFDEEHPPYDELVVRLDAATRAAKRLKELHKL